MGASARLNGPQPVLAGGARLRFQAPRPECKHVRLNAYLGIDATRGDPDCFAALITICACYLAAKTILRANRHSKSGTLSRGPTVSRQPYHSHVNLSQGHIYD